MAKRLAVLVSRDVCHEVASELCLVDILSIECGDLPAHSSVHADAMEALMGAVYLDGGLEAARVFILEHWGARLSQDKMPPRDPKTALQEWVQARLKTVPSYEVVAISGPDHAPVFEVQVSVDGHGQALATGPSKKQAERVAAQLFFEAHCQ